MTSLLALTNEEEGEQFSEHFDDVTITSLADIAVKSGMDGKVEVDGTSVTAYDAVFISPKPETSIYSRVLLEAIQDERVTCNLEPTTFFIMAKKHYLFKVLQEKGVDVPTTVAVSGEKGLTGIQNDIEMPVMARLYEGFREEEIDRVGSFESLKSFAERSEQGKNVVIVQEFVEGDTFEVLYIDGETISLKVEGNIWEEDHEISKSYHSLSSSQQQLVEQTAAAIGTSLCRVKLVGEKVIQVEHNPNLREFKEESGKDVYRRVSTLLKGDTD